MDGDGRLQYGLDIVAKFSKTGNAATLSPSLCALIKLRNRYLHASEFPIAQHLYDEVIAEAQEYTLKIFPEGNWDVASEHDRERDPWPARRIKYGTVDLVRDDAATRKFVKDAQAFVDPYGV